MSEQKQEAAQGTQGEPTRQNGEVPWWRNDPWLGRHLYMENRSKHPELLDGHDWKYVAWFPDGSGIRDADEDPVALKERIEASGDLLEWFVFEYVVPPGSQL